ncbi:multiubiquitin domain-containing protein [Prosthecobacter dejongeii]|uniref:Multi-ubiquitin domain-containing protein n=1 Tax=Prosthecobacter dejongeii TaxID=48465 RepID=A0A7W7YIC2_9BACT|nr:multiubiquitin domain-containing protein [Prosthecobacter dejongeii]MBB5036758.1 hypothetical protein [Prosthecobacter dejongeii]
MNALLADKYSNQNPTPFIHMTSPLKKPLARWNALVQDRVVPLPRRIVSALTIKEQAGVASDFLIVRDYQSPSDVVLEDGVEVDLAQGNVFRIVPRCDAPACTEAPQDPPKLAFFIDDAFEITTQAKQTEDSLRRLFALLPKVELLRDMESPTDIAIGSNETVLFTDGPVFVSCVEIEKHCGQECPPPARRYIIRVDEKRIVVDAPKVTGRDILVLAGLNPDLTMLNQKIGKRFEPVGLEKVVDLTACGVERFTTLPNEQSEGRPNFRRQFALPEEDVELLEGSELAWETINDANGKWVLIRDIPLPEGLLQVPTSVAIQVPSGYPSAALDMAYFSPAVRRLDGGAIPCTEASMQIEGIAWQRWSRHYTSAYPWKLGVYNVFTHYLLSLSWLDREARKVKIA